jgi:twitching motility protein PilT
MVDIKALFQSLVDRDGSDLFLRSFACPRARINGKVELLNEHVIDREGIRLIVNSLMNSEQKRLLEQNMDLDFIHEEPGLGRFRINIFVQRGTPALVARYVHNKAKTFDELCLPGEILKLFCEESKGLVLVCGPAGNGKSTTIASMIEYINMTQSKHIITVEDPIEYLFRDMKSLINQRELGIDVPSYTSALKHVTQQSPDIIYIGNVRDEATMRAAINATELGTFVMTTFHTINAVQTLVRVINFFPPYLHDEMRMQLSMILKGTISLRLVPRADGKGRVPAFETMVVTPTISRLIREGKINDIQSFIDQGELFGMQSFKQSLVKLVNAGMVLTKDARELADSKDEFDLAIKGIHSKF